MNTKNKSIINPDNNPAPNSKLGYFIHKIFYPACVFYLAFTFICSIVTQLIKIVYEIPILSLRGILVIFLFSLAIAASNRIFYINKMTPFGRTALHFVCFIASFTIILEIFGGYYKNPTAALLLLIAIAVVYIICAVIALIIYSIVHRNKNEEKKYKNMFS